MLVYIFVLLVLIYPYLSKGTKACDNSRNRIILYFIVLFLVSGLSYNLGADTRGYTSGIGYVEAFQSVNTLTKLTQMDFSHETWRPGFVYLLSFFKTLSSNYLIYQLFHVFIINFIVILFVKENTKHIGLCLFFYCMLYFFDLNFEIQRESYAIVLGLIVYLYLEKHHSFLSYFIVIGVAVLAYLLIHRSAFILIMYPLLKNVKLNKVKIFVCFVLTCFIQILWIKFSALGGLLDLVAGDTYQGYIQNEFREANAGIGPIYFLWLTFWRVGVPYFFVYLSFINRNPRYLAFVLLSIAFENLTYFSFAFHRMYGYFTPFYWLALTDAVVYLGRKVKLMNNNLFRIVFVICMMVYIINTYHGDYFREDPYPNSDSKYVYNWYFPYQSVLEPGNSYVK